jgi:hypothetical protein
MKARTDFNDNVITFSTLKFYVPIGNKWDRIDSLRIIKEGRIGINKESHSLKISWFVKLDSLYFLALSCSIVVGIIACINTELVISIIIGFLFFLMFVFVGIVLIKAQLSDLINSCVYRNYY